MRSSLFSGNFTEKLNVLSTQNTIEKKHGSLQDATLNQHIKHRPTQPQLAIQTRQTERHSNTQANTATQSRKQTYAHSSAALKLGYLVYGLGRHTSPVFFRASFFTRYP